MNIFMKLAVSLAFCSLTITAHAGQPLVFSTLDKFKPFVWQENGSAKGIDVDIVKELCNRADIELTLEIVPWKRVMHNVESGKTAGGFAAFKTPEREAFSIFLDAPIHESTYNLFVKKGNRFTFDSVEDLFGKKIGNISGFKTGEAFDKAVVEGKITVEVLDDIGKNIKKLMTGRLDAIVGNQAQTLLKLKEMGLTGQVEFLPTPVRESRGAFLIISKAADIENKSGVIAVLNRHLKEMAADGTIQKINDKYLK